MSPKRKILILGLVLMVTLTVRFSQVYSVKYNYFYMNSLGFHGHEIEAVPSGVTPILILGNSAVAGNNVPRNSTVADHFNADLNDPHLKMYNLGNFEQSITESIIYLDLATSITKPKLAILGINCASFPGGGGEDLTIAYEDRLPAIFPQETVQQIMSDNRAKKDQYPRLRRKFPTIIPSPFQIWFSEGAYNLKLASFGPLYSTRLKPGRELDPSLVSRETSQTPQSLKAFRDLARAKGALPVVYFTPILEKDKAYGLEAYKKYKEEMIKTLNELELTYFDYDSLLPASPENFIDYIHATSIGNKITAERLLKDLRDHDLL